MKNLLCFCLLVLTLSCQKTPSDSVDPQQDTVKDEYPDWYTLKAPVDKAIQGVWGDRDKTVLITTGYAVFRSIDKGKHWQSVLQSSINLFGLVQNQDTLFTMSSLLNQSSGATYQQLIVQANHYSLDDGQTWQSYKGRNPVLADIPTYGAVDNRLRINPIISPSGVVYTINRVFVNGSATSGTFETPGIVRSDGRRIDLPQLHQLQSLYLDAQQRLYVAGSDAVCERGHSGERFSFCNSKQGRGVVYISKRPLP